jgi:hypothetical protein
MLTQENPNRESVARRAYELFMSRGGQHGSDREDWYQAERELRGGNGGQASVQGTLQTSSPIVSTVPERALPSVATSDAGRAANRGVRAKSSGAKR